MNYQEMDLPSTQALCEEYRNRLENEVLLYEGTRKQLDQALLKIQELENKIKDKEKPHAASSLDDRTV